jgi:hypothetical protein
MGNVSGTLGTETFRFTEDDSPKLVSNNTNFLLVKHQNGFESFKADGLIGLNIHNNPNKKNIIYNLYEQGQISSPRYSLYLSSGSESRLYIGDYSQNTVISSLYRQMNYCSVGKKEYNWSCNISGIEVNKKSYFVESKFTLDSGISYLIIPISDFKIIKKQIIEETNSDCIFNENHQLLCRCSSPDIFPDLRLKTADGYSPFEIKLNKLIDFFPKLTYSCRFEIFVDMNNYDNWILGANVMRDTLFSFDIASRKIGFYQNPDVKAFVNKENLIVYSEENGDFKIGYAFALIFVFLLLYSLIKCSNNEKFMSGFDKKNSNDSFELDGLGGEKENKMDLLKKDLKKRSNTDFDKYTMIKDFEEKNPITKNDKLNNNNIKDFINDGGEKNKILNASIEINDHNNSNKSKNEKLKFLNKI